MEMINPMSLEGRHVVVTGASSGIGAEVCRHVARLGGRVSMLARDEGRLERVLGELEGAGHGYIPIDLSDIEGIEGPLEALRAERGRFDGAVYCAGVGDSRPLRQTKPALLEKVALTNYLAYVEFARCATLRKNRAETMSVVGMSSVMSVHGDKGNTMYGSTKAAMDGAMRSIARELAGDGVRANNVRAGWVRTDMYQRKVDLLGEEGMSDELSVFQYMGRLIEPVEVANAVAFLLSDASSCITGTTMVVAGGYLS